jgi:hypothetical protein
MLSQTKLRTKLTLTKEYNLKALIDERSKSIAETVNEK